MAIDGVKVAYTATAGTLILRDAAGLAVFDGALRRYIEPSASM